MKSQTKRPLIEGSKGSRSAVRGRASSIVHLNSKQAPSRGISEPTPEPAPKQPEFCCVPFPIGSIVALKCCPSRQYTVVSVETGVRTEIKPGEANPGHISQPKDQGVAQHYYRLRNDSGGDAYWWHHQLTCCEI